MRLLALRLRHFRGFEEAEYRFDPGLNVLVGPNEAGKSTLRQAILAAFFVNPATTAKRREEWRPWGSDRLGSVSLEFELEGRRFDLRKDFERRHTDLRDLINGVSYEGSRVQERLQAALGLSTEALFRSTAMIEQMELTVLRSGAADIGQRLSRIIQAGPGDAEAGAVIKKLEKELSELQKGLDKKGLDRPVKTPGTIRGLQDEVSSLTRERDELVRRVARLEAQREELRRIRREGEAAGRDLGDAAELLGFNKDLLAYEAQLAPLRAQARQFADRLAAVERGYDRLAEIARELETLQAGGVPDDDTIAAIQTSQALLERQHRVVTHHQAAIGEVGARLEGLARPVPAPSLWATAAASLLLLLAVAAGGAALAGFASVVAGIVALLGGAGGILLLLAQAARRRLREDRREQQERMLLRLEELRANLAAAADELRAEEDAFKTAVAASGSATAEEALARRTSLRVLTKDQTAVQNQVAAHLGAASPAELRDEHDRLRADVAGRDMALTRPEAQAKRVTQLEYQRLERTVDQLTQTVHRLRARQEQLEQTTAEGAPDDEALAATEERLADKTEALEGARRRERVLRLAAEGLREARQQTLIPARQLVEERAGAYLSLLTGGAYGQVRITEPPLAVTVWVEGAGLWVEPAEPALSRGTADQVYLAVRLALVEVLSEGRHPPLLLDDPFGSFDPERLAAAMALLRRVAETHQVLLFTCRPEYEPFADRVIPVDAAAPPAPELPGPLWQPPPPTH